VQNRHGSGSVRAADSGSPVAGRVADCSALTSWPAGVNNRFRTPVGFGPVSEHRRIPVKLVCKHYGVFTSNPVPNGLPSEENFYG
jgi:hypothetical protein